MQTSVSLLFPPSRALFCLPPDGRAPVSVRARGIALLPAGGGEPTAEGEAGVCEGPEPEPRADGAQQEAAGGGGGRSAQAAGVRSDEPEPGRAVPQGDRGESPTRDPTQTRGGQPLPAGTRRKSETQGLLLAL